jgi:hypothetical protein
MASHWHDEEIQKLYYEYLVARVKGKYPASYHRILHDWVSDGMLSKNFLEAYHPDVLAEIKARIH